MTPYPAGNIMQGFDEVVSNPVAFYPFASAMFSADHPDLRMPLRFPVTAFSVCDFDFANDVASRMGGNQTLALLLHRR